METENPHAGGTSAGCARGLAGPCRGFLACRQARKNMNDKILGEEGRKEKQIATSSVVYGTGKANPLLLRVLQMQHCQGSTESRGWEKRLLGHIQAGELRSPGMGVSIGSCKIPCAPHAVPQCDQRDVRGGFAMGWLFKHPHFPPGSPCASVSSHVQWGRQHFHRVYQASGAGLLKPMNSAMFCKRPGL